MKTKHFSVFGLLAVLLALGLVLAGCDNGTMSEGEGFDSALVGTWHSTQAAADSGEYAAFEFTADGILTGDAFTAGVVNVTTSNGRISATLTLNGNTVDAGSADYELDHGTELMFSSPSVGGMNVFTSLISGQAISIAAGRAGCYYKSSVGSSSGGFDSALVATWHSTQEAANNEQYAAFEFTDEGILTGDAFTAGIVNVTTSNGRISATLTLNGNTVDAGSVDYEVSHGTELRFSNPSVGGMNIFTPLISGQQVSSAAGGAGCYYKKAGGGGTGGETDGKQPGTSGTGTGGTGTSGGGNGGGIDNALVGTWHYSAQEAVNNGQYAAFEFTADGSLTIAGQSSDMVITVTTSNGRISATLTLSGNTMDAGSANYTVSGTTLSFSNPSGGDINIFTVLQQVSSAAGGSGYYYKAGGGGGGTGSGGGTDGKGTETDGKNGGSGNGEIGGNDGDGNGDKGAGTGGTGGSEPGNGGNDDKRPEPDKPAEPDGGENGGPGGGEPEPVPENPAKSEPNRPA
jgi:hypothetical protein